MPLTQPRRNDSSARQDSPAGFEIGRDADWRRDLLDSAMASVRATRRVELSDPPEYNLADIGNLERDLPIFEARLMRISGERFRQRDTRRSILNRVKNRVQIYLMAIENGTTIPWDDLDASAEADRG